MRNFDVEKAKAAVLYILENLKKADFHTIFKILYFADREHLAKYGRTIINDDYIAMSWGPVPSTIYDGFKHIRVQNFAFNNFSSFYNAFEIEGRTMVIPKEKPDIDELSKSDLECLDKAIIDISPLNFNQRKEKSHDYAWKNACQDGTIDILHIAKEGGADHEMLKYIIENISSSNIEIA